VLGDINNDKKLDVIMGQGEGKEGIEERIFIAKNTAPDTAPPVISHYELTTDTATGTTTIKARIHDNKSPNMPQDWHSVSVLADDRPAPVPMSWYGENLWVARIQNSHEKAQYTICATDHSGNKKCLTLPQ
jgi:hypothetical protein